MFRISAVYKCLYIQAGLIPARQPLHNPNISYSSKTVAIPFVAHVYTFRSTFLLVKLSFLSNTVGHSKIQRLIIIPRFSPFKSNSINLP